jgi:3-oxoacyl-[acyl-carrier protein] reductase
LSVVADLAGRRIVVTGATGAIGTVVCATLAARGAELVLVARDAARLGGLAAALAGGPHTALNLDVRDTDAWAEAARSHLNGLPVHGLVTAAAVIGPIGPLGSFDMTGFRETVDTNLVGTLLAVSAALDGLRSARGAVVTFSGGGATGLLPRFDAYAVSKAAVVRLTENLAAELAPAGVRANSVAPGFVVSPMHDATLRAGSHLAGEAYFERTRRAVEEGGGDPPQDAADLVAFLLSDAAAGISGKLVSARWDPWRDARFCDRLREDGDLATLRRVDDQFFTAVR